MTKANAARKSVYNVSQQEQQKQPSGLDGAFNQLVRIVKPVVKDTLPVLKKFGPILLATDPPVAAAVLGAIVAGSALGHGARRLAQQQASKKSKPPAP